MDTNKDPVPTMEQQDVLIRWSEKVLNEENRFDPNAFGTVTSIGTVFGKPAVLKAVYCLDNSFADLRVDIGGEDPENSRVRIFIMFKAMQGIQVFLNYGDVADDNLLIKIDMSRNSKSLPRTQCQRYWITSKKSWRNQPYCSAKGVTVKPIKFLQKIGHDDFKDISAQARSGTLHVIRDPQPGAIKPDHIIGRVSSAFNLGKKVEVMADFVYWGPEKQDLKFAKVDSVWYLTVINKPEKP